MDQTPEHIGGPARPLPLTPGLWFVSTPIGAARDITLRALDILASAEVLVAEDTRTLRHLMEIHGLRLGDRPMIAYHDHNGAEARPRILRALAEGRSVAYASEAGTPVVADPGYQLARAAIEAGHLVSAAPGPTAAIMALSVSGLPSDRFLFAGFASPQAGARARWIEEIGSIPATLILYESPKRVHRLLGELCDHWGEMRPAALCRELTKRFEEVRRGTLGSLRDGIGDVAPKGEIVLVVGRPLPVVPEAADVDAALVAAMARLRVKDAAAEVAEALGLPRRDVYQRALALKEGNEA
ncbi:16S rRNA (cytidine(1402)-2'-O)-methyltransferase [Roseicyclus mahoneyensis]|uniref:Ribosomal RNA small subunit methyltransferase I n=1 Tax=Roseicyclus mahoneyensis TaxID=164332 RepID=A0A316GFE5_9RHOB|nr:16S rRNA (cytidine(1402)-2'-O)-methyltransferase [Roseicyclus mahoneyensis]PWK59333.1 16S rRNA (cytidine1402-2'-O)-methyltransferase [Roseicyclus mahoneyensis]